MFCETWCLLLDLLVFVWFADNMLFCIIIYRFDFIAVFCDIYLEILRVSFLHKTANNCLFLLQETCGYVNITASICFENLFRTGPKIEDFKISKKLLYDFLSIWWKYNEVLRRWNEMNKTDRERFKFEKINLIKKWLKNKIATSWLFISLLSQISFYGSVVTPLQ